MNTLDKLHEIGIPETCDPPCLSLYQPTHRHYPDNQKDPILFGNLVKELEESLLQQLPEQQVKPLLAPFKELAENREFWNHTLDGLAVLSAKGQFRVFRLHRTMPELALVADSFHIKPLIRVLQSADRYQVLGLTRHEIKLYAGNRDGLEEIPLHEEVPRTLTDALGEELTEPHLTVASYGGAGGSQAPMYHGHGGRKADIGSDAERFFRAVDRAVLKHHSQPTGLPLILAALPEHHHLFHQVSDNPFLLPDSIDRHPDSLASLDELRAQAWKVMEPRYLARLAALSEEFGNARANGLGNDDLVEVAKAVVSGRTATLLIEDRREIPGRINPTTGTIEPEELDRPHASDVLDDLGMLALKMGGEVVIVPHERMPTTTGIAAIYRH